MSTRTTQRDKEQAIERYQELTMRVDLLRLLFTETQSELESLRRWLYERELISEEEYNETD